MANKLAEIDKNKRKTQMPDLLRNSFNTAHFSHELVVEGEERESSHTEQSYATDHPYEQDESDGGKNAPFVR